MNLDRAFEKAMKNPETRVKIYIAYNIGLALVNLTIILGLGFLFLRYAGIV
jgi:F0F1-type ATP synthase membrane subunit c/vacuolar-type H+-ATPase subunit K